MSKHIGVVYSSERNPRSPSVNVDASRGGVEVSSVTLNSGDVALYERFVSLQPADARTLAALLMRAADEAERIRGAAGDEMTSSKRGYPHVKLEGAEALRPGTHEVSFVSYDETTNTAVYRFKR